MNNYKICVYAICKNEEKFVDRWMDSVGEADLVVVSDTGSTDGTVERLRARGAQVYTDIVDPWRFDTARNLAMDHLPEDADICVSNDLDEIFEPGWRERLEAAWKPIHTRARYQFVWSRNEDGSVQKQFVMEKIHRRHGYRWVHPVHEVLEYSGPGEEQKVWIPNLVLDHRPDPSKPRGQYLPLLELSARENPLDDRVSFWLGREYMFHGQNDEAISELGRYLRLPSAVWTEERCAAMRYIAACHLKKGDAPSAVSWLYRALAECPNIREPYYDLAMFGYRQRNWPLVLAMAHEGLKATSPTGSYLYEPGAWGASLHDLGSLAAYELGNPRLARDFALEALKKDPGNRRLTENLRLIEQAIQKGGGA